MHHKKVVTVLHLLKKSSITYFLIYFLTAHAYFDNTSNTSTSALEAYAAAKRTRLQMAENQKIFNHQQQLFQQQQQHQAQMLRHYQQTYYSRQHQQQQQQTTQQQITTQEQIKQEQIKQQQNVI